MSMKYKTIWHAINGTNKIANFCFVIEHEFVSVYRDPNIYDKHWSRWRLKILPGAAVPETTSMLKHKDSSLTLLHNIKFGEGGEEIYNSLSKAKRQAELYVCEMLQMMELIK